MHEPILLVQTQLVFVSIANSRELATEWLLDLHRKVLAGILPVFWIQRFRALRHDEREDAEENATMRAKAALFGSVDGDPSETLIVVSNYLAALGCGSEATSVSVPHAVLRPA
jgi:hypothetical protein